MYVLVIGGGGREHALAWKIAQSPLVKKVFCAPGNPGTAMIGENVPIEATDLPALLAFAKKEGIHLTVVGPELPLTMGIVDLFEDEGLKIFGCRKNAALLEGDKAFSKNMMQKYGVPTAKYGVFTDYLSAMDFIDDELGKPPYVIKATGLAAGKGVIIVQSRVEALEVIRGMLSGKLFGDAGRKIVVEEFLTGEEASFLAFTDGISIIPLASAQDHKALFDGDRGPNTGGMGAYSPAPVVTPAIHEIAMTEVMRRMVDGMAKEGRPYRGVLYAGLMIKGDSVKTLEFNARFGDPECQPLMMRMKSDIVPIMLEIANHGNIDGFELEWDPRPSLCVVQAAHGYPDNPRKGDEISGLEDLDDWKDIVAFLAGVKVVDGKLVTDGGRITGITGIAETMQAVIDLVYPAAHMVDFDGRQFRDDIGRKALGR